jgi:adenosylhomocysteine nucleosidase
MMASQDSRPRLVFVAALPREVASLVKGWRGDEGLRGRGVHLYWSGDAVVACAGMGTHRAALAVEAALAIGPVSQLVSIGWAGACNAEYKAGDVVRAQVVIDARTGERFFTEDTEPNERGKEIVVTVAQPANVAEKKRLSLSYQANAVDMEAAAVARIARARELPFYAIKAISDEADLELPDMARFSTPTGQFREAAFGVHVALRPSLWKPVATLARGSTLAAQRLSTEVEAHIQRLHIQRDRERAQ